MYVLELIGYYMYLVRVRDEDYKGNKSSSQGSSPLVVPNFFRKDL